jgi:hypothetical protein
MKRRWKYRTLPTTSLRAYLRVLSVPGVRWLFADDIAAIELELLARELPLLADDSGGYLVSWILGEQ